MAAELLGRDSELAVLTGLLEEARAGELRVALVCGEPGIGKTTLVEALAGVAAEAGFSTVWGRCWEGGGVGPYWPWAQVLRACLRDEGDALLSVVGPGRAELGRLLPEYGALAEEPAALDAEDARMRLFMAVADVLEASTGTGLVVALDDLHDADEGSLQLLRFLARGALSAPLLLVGTYRVREVAGSPAHQVALGAVSRQNPTVRLGTLSQADVSALVDRIGAHAAKQRLDEVYEATGGNPFLVYEASRLLTSTQTGSTAISLLERTGSSLVNTRLDPLPPSVRDVLDAAAVLGRDFSLAVLRQLCDVPPDDLVDLLAQACDLHVVEETALGRWSFSHSLLREELLAQLPAEDRRRLHRRAAAVLQSDSIDDAGSGVATIAHHLVEGRDPAALETTVQAARSAMDTLAFEDAAVWFERALSLPAAGVPDEARYEILLELGDVLLRAGQITRAIEAFDRGIKIGQALGSLELAAEAAIRIAPYTTTDATVIGALDDALCDLPETDSGLRARVLVCFAQVLKSSSVDRNVLQDVSRQGLDMARRVGDEETLWSVLVQWHQNVPGILTPEQRAERLRASEEMVRMAAAAGVPQRLFQARLSRAADLLATGEPALALAEGEDCLSAARALRQPIAERQALLFLVTAHVFVGEIAAAEDMAERLGDSRVAVDAERADLEMSKTMTTLRRAQGRFSDVERLTRESLDRWEPYGLQCATEVALVNALAEQGRKDEARVELDKAVEGRLVEETFGMTVPIWGWVPAPRLCCPCAVIEACCLLDDREGVETLYGHLLPHAEAFSVDQGLCARYLGLAAARLGRYDEADAHFQRAHIISERLGARLFGARGRLDHGRTLLERGHPADQERAAELLGAAREAFQDMGIEVFAARAAELLRRVRPAAPPVVAGARLVEEGEYWAFHYEGDVARVRDTKGLRYLAQLLRNPGQELPATDLSGTPDAEQARQSVTRAVKTAVDRLGAVHPPLGEHLRSTVRTGVVSVYLPDPRAPITWDP